MMEFVVAAEASREENERKGDPSALRQIDITVGAALMFIGVKISLLTALSFGGKFFFSGVSILLLMMGIFYALLLLLSRASHRRRGLNVGVNLMLLLALIATLFAPATESVSFLIVGVLSIPLVLLWSRIHRFFFDGAPTAQTSQGTVIPSFFNPVTSETPTSQGQTTANLNPRPFQLEEADARFSVTEESTALFENKVPRNQI